MGNTASFSPTSAYGDRASPRSWISSLARASVISFLKQAIQVGYLEVQDGPETLYFGHFAKDNNAVHLDVVQDSFWRRVFTSGDLGFSEAYISGDINIRADDLQGVFGLWLDNEPRMRGLSSSISRLLSLISGLWNAFFGQTLNQARLNVIAAYDQSNDLFSAFLSNEMMYSCAFWSSEEGGVRGDLDQPPASALSPVDGLHPLCNLKSAASSTETLIGDLRTAIPATLSIKRGELEAAQRRKIHHALKKLRLEPGARLLEVGSGWGGLAIEAARTYGCAVDTLTLSVEQKKLAEERIWAAGLSDRITVHLMDYRDMPKHWQSSFDAFISIEMLEHVGSKHYNAYFRLVDWALKPSNSSAVVSCSTFPESRYSDYQAEDFMRRYMWPNSCLPSATTLVQAAHRASAGRFTLESVENHSAHYPRTLREWGRRLEANLTPQDLELELGCDGPAPGAGADPRLTRRLPTSASASSGGGLAQGDFEAIKRKWQYLFAYAAAGFAKGYITCHMISFSKNACPEPCT